MKIKLLLLLILSQYFLGQKIEVMTFNIRLSLDSDKENSWANRKSEALALMTYYHPDVMGVQEALPQQMDDMKIGLKNYKSIGVGRDDGANNGEFSALFFDADKIELVKSGIFWLSETPEKPSKGWDAALNRICTYGLFKMKKGGKRFWVFNTHFDHIGNLARKNSAQLILEKIKEFNTQKLPVVLMGDFNQTESSEPIKIISKQLKDTYYKAQKTHYGPSGTFQAFDVSVPAKERIDFIFADGFKIMSNRTINDRRENLLYPSDHFPVIAEIEFP